VSFISETINTNKKPSTGKLSSLFQDTTKNADSEIIAYIKKSLDTDPSVWENRKKDEKYRSKVQERTEKRKRYQDFITKHREPFIEKMEAGNLTLEDLQSPFQESFDKKKERHYTPIATEKEMNTKEYFSDVRTNTQRIFQDVDACIRFWGDTLEVMFEAAEKEGKEPEILTLFETGKSSALDNKFLRQAAEEAHFGYPAPSWRDYESPTKDKDRPVYGHAASKGKGGRVEDPEVAKILNRYGTVVLVLDESVHKATFAIAGDSLSSHRDIHPNPPEVTAIPAPLNNLNEDIYQIEPGKQIDPSTFQDFEDLVKKTGKFVELQFHRAIYGPLKINKELIKKVYFLDPNNVTHPNPRDGSNRRDSKVTHEKLKEWFTKKGIPHDTLEL